MQLLGLLFLEPLIKHKENWTEYILDSKLGKHLEKCKKNNQLDNLENSEMEITDNFPTFADIVGIKH